jgi:hypothetical protein
MPERRLLDGDAWRIFRLFLVDLEDPELQQVNHQLQCEIANRRDCETDFTRLFFSSLQSGDLETAKLTIRAERLARVQDRRRLRRSTVPRSRPRATL